MPVFQCLPAFIAAFSRVIAKNFHLCEENCSYFSIKVMYIWHSKPNTVKIGRKSGKTFAQVWIFSNNFWNPVNLPGRRPHQAATQLQNPMQPGFSNPAGKNAKVRDQNRQHGRCWKTRNASICSFMKSSFRDMSKTKFSSRTLAFSYQLEGRAW